MTEKVSTREASPLPPIEQHEWSGDFWRAYSAQTASERHPAENQDVVLVHEKLGLVTLCDGMGGLEDGREAAATAAVAIAEYFEQVDFKFGDHEALDVLPGEMMKAMKYAQAKLIEKRSKSHMNTTATSLLMHKLSGGAVMVIIGHVGNSRAYAVEDVGEVSQITEDGDIMAKPDGARLILGDIGPSELSRRKREVRDELQNAQNKADLSGQARMLLQYRSETMGVGSHDMFVSVDVLRFPEGGRMVLLSDGAFENLGRRTGGYLSMASAQPTKTVAEEMVREAQQNGHARPKNIVTSHPDDISAVFIEVT